MKKIITLSCLIFIFIHSMAFAGVWDRTDKILFGTFTTSMVIDCLQTNYCCSSRGDLVRHYGNNFYYEKLNPILKCGIKAIGKEFIPIYFGGCILGGWYILDKFSSRNRKIILTGLILFNGVIISRNKNLGIGFDFKF